MYSICSILVVTNIDVFRYILALNTSILVGCVSRFLSSVPFCRMHFRNDISTASFAFFFLDDHV
jgi:hypothetical protein